MFDIFFIVLWTLLIFSSVAWYAFLLFYVGYKGAREIKEMTATLAARNAETDKANK